MTKRQPKTLREQTVEAEQRASYWLAEANSLSERGEKEKAEKVYDTAQYWLDLYNKLASNA